MPQGEYVAPEKPTYGNNKKWIKDIYGFNIFSLYITQIKDNYNQGEGKSSQKFTPKINLLIRLSGGKMIMNDLQKRGYLVKETGAVYYSMDMDKTLAWFTDVLGWYGQIDARDENNVGMYGCVNNIPIEFESLGLAPFTVIHMFHGETDKRMIGFMKVEGIEKLHDYVVSKGWTEIEDVVCEHWGSKSCVVTTIDGCQLKFFQ